MLNQLCSLWQQTLGDFKRQIRQTKLVLQYQSKHWATIIAVITSSKQVQKRSQQGDT